MNHPVTTLSIPSGSLEVLFEGDTIEVPIHGVMRLDKATQTMYFTLRHGRTQDHCQGKRGVRQCNGRALPNGYCYTCRGQAPKVLA